MYLKGKKFEIVWRKSGKKTIGITNPDKISLIAIKILVTPTSFIVNKVNTWYSVIIEVIKNVPTVRVSINKMNEIKDAGRDNPIGAGKRNATIVTGNALKHTLARRVDITFEYHILYISTGLHNS